jgi:uncharacterized membrane protein
MRRTENLVSHTLLIGAISSAALVTVSALLNLAGFSSSAPLMGKIGVLLLLLTPLARMVAALTSYVAAGNRKMATITSGVIIILLTATSLAIRGA